MLDKTRGKSLLCPLRSSLSFTLIELLVVIAIIALLASMLLPALMQAREMGRRIKCVSHLKQLTLAMLIYSEDYDGVVGFQRYKSGGNNIAYTERFSDNGYLPYGDVYVCPSASPYRFTDSTPSYLKRTYGAPNKGYLETFHPDYGGGGGVWSNWSLFGATSETGSHWILLKRITNVTDCPVFVDSVYPLSDPPRQDRYFSAGYFGQGTGPSAAYNNYPPHLRHSGTCNIGFADGHAESCTKERLKELGFIGAYDENGAEVDL